MRIAHDAAIALACAFGTLVMLFASPALAGPPTLSCDVSKNQACDGGDFSALGGGFTLSLQTPATCKPPPPSKISLFDPSQKAAFTCESSSSGTYVCKSDPPMTADALSSLKSLQGEVCGNEFSIKPTATAPTPTAPKEDVAGLAFLPISEWQSTLKDLGLPSQDHELGHYYDEHGDRAVIFLDADGNPFFPMLDIVDENDSLWIAIVDDTKRLEGLEISIQGCTPAPIEPRVYGTPPTNQVLLKSTGYGGLREVGRVYKAIGKCAAGNVSVGLRRGTTSHTTTIPVNPLYRFSVGVAAAYDATMQRSFAVRTAYGDSTPRIAESREPLGLSSLFFVSMYFVARDFHKSDFSRFGRVTQRLQLFAGLDPRDIAKNLVLGLGFELAPGFDLLVGARVLTKQTILTEGSGLANGTAFSGGSGDIPTRERWEMGGLFAGVGLTTDLLAKIR